MTRFNEFRRPRKAGLHGRTATTVYAVAAAARSTTAVRDRLTSAAVAASWSLPTIGAEPDQRDERTEEMVAAIARLMRPG